MKIYPRKHEVGIKPEDESEVTFVDGTRITKNIDNSLERSDKVKKKGKNSSIHENMWISQNGNDHLQVAQNESESLLKSKKRRHRKSKVNKEQLDCIQSQSFLNGINLSDTLLTDDSESNGLDKRKKRKVKSEGNNEPWNKKKRIGTIEFLTQNIFKQPSSEEFFNSTPYSSPKKVKKKDKEVSLHHKDSPDRKNTSYVSKEVKYKHEKINGDNGQEINFNSRKMLFNQSTEDLKLHSSIYLSDSDDKSEILPNKTCIKNKQVRNEANNNASEILFNQSTEESKLHTSVSLSDLDDKSEFLSNKIHKKNKRSEQDQTEANNNARLNGHADAHSEAYNDSMDESIRLDGKNNFNNSDNSASKQQTIVKKKKKKHKKFSSPDLNRFDHTESSARDSMSPDFNGSGYYRNKKSNSNLNVPDLVLDERSGYENKLGVYSPSQSLTVHNSELNGNSDGQSEVDNDLNESIHSSRKKSFQNHDDNELTKSTVVKKKKKKHKEFSSPILNRLETNTSSTRDSVSPAFNADVLYKNKKSNPNLSFPDPVLDERSGDESKLGLYSPSRSLTVDNSKSKSAISVRQDLSNNSTDNSSNRSNTKESDSSSDEGVEEDANFEFQRMFKDKSFDVDFIVPELHKILNRASKPTPQQRALIALRDIKVKYGKFSKEEDKQIKGNWRYFIEENGLEDKPEIFFCLNKRYISLNSKRNFLFYLARNMPERSPYGVFKRFKLLHARTKKGRFTQEEDDFITKMIKEYGDGRIFVTEIAQHLQRSAVAVEKHINKMRNAHTRKIKWKNQNAATFIKYLLKVTNTSEENIRDLKHRQISTTEWAKLSKKLDGVPVRILRRAWLEKLYPALFIPGHSCDLRQVKFKLIKMFYDNKENDWRKVNWNYYASQFEGFTYLRVYSLLQQLVKAHVPPSKKNDLHKCLKVLIKLQEQNIREHVMYKIKYRKGTIQDLSSD